MNPLTTLRHGYIGPDNRIAVLIVIDFMMKIAQCYGLPVGMVADRDPHWAKSFRRSVADELGLELLLSTSHHPQMDGQLEQAIQHLAISL